MTDLTPITVPFGSILSLDLGTNCGWCQRIGDAIKGSGVWDLKPKRFEGGGMRFLRFTKKLEDVHAMSPIKLLTYEEVRRHMGVDAAHCYGGFQSHLLAFAELHEIPLTSYPVGTIKKLATGKGNANKEKMLAAAQERWPELNITSPDHADALWISQCAFNEYG